nr:protocadherin alpha-2 isoform X13 [Chlorocebus sabaeus]
MASSIRRGREAWTWLLSLLLLAAWEVGSGQLRYSVSEEAKHGTFVGRIAQDLGLELAELVPRLFRVASKTHGDLLEVNLQNGILFVNSRIDREELCGRSAECSIHLEVIVDRPLQVFHVDVEVKDINDNPPVFPMTVKIIRFPESRLLNSRFPLEGASDADIGVNALLSYKLSSKNASLGTVIALITVSDRDSGTNGHVTCSLTPHVPFKLVPTFKNYYSLVLDNSLDRESVSAYELVVTARDGGSPSLWATASLSVQVADVNDNAPTFAQPEYTVFVKENNPPGCHIFTVSAWDADAQENALVSYSLVERRVGERALSSYVSVHAESGKVYALQPLDREELELLQFQVSARDAGVPSLSSNVTLQVFVLDENDNAPALLAPRAGTAAGAVSELVPWSVGAGYVVAKVRAVDADSGYNAWLSYELQLGTGSARIPFRVGLYTGEISTTRALDETDSPRHRLLVMVKDHGEPTLTATATVLVSLVESGQAPKASSRAWVGAAGSEATLVDVNVYLIIAICAVSSLLVLTVLLYTALRCSVPPTEGARVPGKPTLVCSSAVGSWSYSQQRRQRVCSGEDPPKTDLMAFSPSLSQGPDSTEERQLSESEYVGKPRQPNPDWRYSASLRAGMHSSVHLEEAGVLRAGPGGPDQQWPTVSSATPEPEAGEVSPPVGAGVNSNSWTFKYGPGNPKQSGPGELPDKFIIPGSPAIISIRQEPTNNQIDKSDFITFGKKEETKKKKKKKKGNKTQEKKEKGNSTTDNSDQ